MQDELKSVEEMAYAIQKAFSDEGMHYNLDDIHVTLMQAQKLGFLVAGPSNDKFVI